MVIGIGIFGALFSAKLNERFQLHIKRSREYRRALEETVPNSKIKELISNARQKHEEKATLHPIRLHILWMSLNLFIAILGIIVIILAIIS